MKGYNYTDEELRVGQEILQEFDKLSEEKWKSKIPKYGPPVGDTPFEDIVDHLIDEFAEFLVAVYGNNCKEKVTLLVYYMNHRLSIGESVDVATELFDIKNTAKMAYLSGKVQGIL